MNRRFFIAVFGAVLFAGSPALNAAPLQTSAPSASPEQQTPSTSAPPPTQKSAPSQVPNLPGYDQQQPKPTPPASDSARPMPAPNQDLSNGPPAEAPLPPPPPLPVPPRPAYVQNPKVPALPPYKPEPVEFVASPFSSTYIPLDSWMYQAVLRLYSLGYVDTAYLGLRPWTRLSVLHMLARSAEKIDANEPPDSQARQIYDALRDELERVDEVSPGKFPGHAEVDTVYSRLRGITGPSLNVLDSYTVGQTVVNDYGRPYAEGFNNVTGFSARAEQGRFSFYFRGEYQHAPAWTGYNGSQALYLQNYFENYTAEFPGGVPTLTVPTGYISSQSNLRVLETDLAVHLAGHEISFGKHDEWLGPNEGGSFAYSNNAEPIYAFKINRVEPLYIPLVSRVLGPVRYQFFVGSLKGHNVPSDPWIHAEKFSFKPTANFEFGFERNVIWGGRDHQGISFGTFWRSFYSISDTNPVEKCLENPDGTAPPVGYLPPHVQDCRDPGARFSQFDYSYRLPYLRNWLTWTVDSFVHDDVTPVSTPRRSAYRTGMYLSHFPGAPKLDLRVEAASTNPTTNATSGTFFYWETIQHEGVTNKGVLFSDIIGNQNQGGQAWLTYHLSPSEYLQLGTRTSKGAKDFIPGGTTQWDYNGTAVKRLGQQVELKGWLQYERYNIPFLKPGVQNDTTMSLQITWFPGLRASD